MFGWSVQGWLGILIVCFGFGLMFDPRLNHVPFVEYIGLAMVVAGTGMTDLVTGWYGSVYQHVSDDDAPNAQPGRRIWMAIFFMLWLALALGKEYLNRRDQERFRQAAEQLDAGTDAKEIYIINKNQ